VHHVEELREELNDVGGRIVVIMQPALLAFSEITNVALDREEHEASDRNVAGEHVEAIASYARSLTVGAR